jgi:hypothetical protein
MTTNGTSMGAGIVPTGKPMQKLAYTALESISLPRSVQRLDYIAQRVLGKRVLDLGALDETALDAKKEKGTWLHARLCAAAAGVVGIDNSDLVPPEGLATAANGRIIKADIFDLSPVVCEFGTPQVIIAGELIEHLPDTLGWLRSLKDNPDLAGAELVFSTPNACSWHNFLIGLAGRESTHPDHLQIYSYKTLRTLVERSGLELQELVPYHARFDEMLEATKGVKHAAVRTFQGAINLLECFTPALNAGWIGVARI